MIVLRKCKDFKLFSRYFEFLESVCIITVSAAKTFQENVVIIYGRKNYSRFVFHGVNDWVNWHKTESYLWICYSTLKTTKILKAYMRGKQKITQGESCFFAGG